MDVIKFKNAEYPRFQANGNASQFAIPFAKYFCSGVGYDIGYGKDEWKLPGAIGIDLKDGNNALELPQELVDYVYSSHCLEHLPNWVNALDHWISRLKVGGILFLYLPHYSQVYWRPWNCKKHIHVLSAEVIWDYLYDRGMSKITFSERDLNNSFMVVAEK